MEQVQRNPQLAFHIHKQGPKHIEDAVACVLTKADEIGIIRCEHPNYSAQLFFGIVRELEWRVLMNIYVEENEQENLEYVHYCVDRFLAGHQKV
jgi:TetR/AcrR family transcriptional repressor of adeIJK operon